VQTAYRAKSSFLSSKEMMPDPSPLRDQTCSSEVAIKIENGSSTSVDKSEPVDSGATAIIAPFMSKYLPQDRANYCYRHNPDAAYAKRADAKTMRELQESLDKLDPNDREAITHVWSIFSAAPSSQRITILQGLLTQCCFSQLSAVSSMVKELIRIDFISALPTELAFKVLCYLDTGSLCSAAQVSRHWRKLADDDIVWHRMCEQHIDKKCTKCGWGLPLLEKKRLRDSKVRLEARRKELSGEGRSSVEELAGQANKRKFCDITNDGPAVCSANTDPVASQASSASPVAASSSDSESHQLFISNPDKLDSDTLTVGEPQRLETRPSAAKKTRPWKEVYSERYKIERNWRNGHYKIKEFKDTNSVLCLQFDEQYLITGTYDGNVKVWDVETCQLVRVMQGHVRAVSALKFDSSKLITGSWDRTVRIWNYHNGECVCTFRGHEQNVLCLDFDQKLIASGSADTNIKVWNFEEKSCYTLRGHKEWVNSVKIHSASGTLYSASEDITIRMWDLHTKQCIKVFGGPGEPLGHVAQVQVVLPLLLDHLEGDQEHWSRPIVKDSVRVREDAYSTREDVGRDLGALDEETLHASRIILTEDQKRRIDHRPTHLLTSSFDNTIKLWDIKTGECVRTLFGHVEGVWSIAADNFRIISGGHDKLVKVWDLQSGKCWHTFSEHTKPVCSVGLSDTRFASAGDDGVVKMYCFDAGEV
jgi:F-box and WD-40 domain protein MET30